MRTEVIEQEFNTIVCDICGEEVPMIEDPIYGASFQALSDAMSPRKWWRKPLDRIVGIKKGSVLDEANSSDFDVHVKCGYRVIKDAVIKRRESNDPNN